MRRFRQLLRSFSGHPWRYLAFLVVTDAILLGIVALLIHMDAERVIAMGAVVAISAGLNAMTQSRWAAENEKRVPTAWTPPPNRPGQR